MIGGLAVAELGVVGAGVPGDPSGLKSSSKRVMVEVAFDDYALSRWMADVLLNSVPTQK